MGVYFPNMKKPPTCLECPVKLDCGLYFDIPVGGIDSNCPVIYVNSPHGKLGDLDALMEYFTPDSYWLNKLHKTQDGFDKETWTNKELRHLINKAPTIVPAEGGGEVDKKTNCSNCGNRNTPVCKYCEHDAEGDSKE